MKLTKQDIQFIDNYLANSDVKHIDIRLEMIDHVATAIEAKMEAGDRRDFYYIFKDYMVENKRRLLESNRKFIRETDIKLSKRLLKNLLTLPSISSSLIVFFLLIQLRDYFSFDIIKNRASLTMLTLFVLFGIIYYLILKYSKKERISSVERFSFIFTILFNVFHFGWNMSGFVKSYEYESVIFIMISIIVGLFVALILSTIQLLKESNLKYNSIL